jgi:hypothetical protein
MKLAQRAESGRNPHSQMTRGTVAPVGWSTGR